MVFNQKQVFLRNFIESLLVNYVRIYIYLNLKIYKLPINFCIWQNRNVEWGCRQKLGLNRKDKYAQNRRN